MYYGAGGSTLGIGGSGGPIQYNAGQTPTVSTPGSIPAASPVSSPYGGGYNFVPGGSNPNPAANKWDVPQGGQGNSGGASTGGMAFPQAGGPAMAALGAIGAFAPPTPGQGAPGGPSGFADAYQQQMGQMSQQYQTIFAATQNQMGAGGGVQFPYGGGGVIGG